MDNSELLNKSTIEQFKPELYVKLVSRFKTEFNSITYNLINLLDNDVFTDAQMDEFETLSHTIKGSAAVIGFKRVQKIAVDLELKSKERLLINSENIQQCIRMVKRMKEAYDLTLLYVDKLIF